MRALLRYSAPTLHEAPSAVVGVGVAVPDGELALSLVDVPVGVDDGVAPMDADIDGVELRLDEKEELPVATADSVEELPVAAADGVGVVADGGLTPSG